MPISSKDTFLIQTLSVSQDTVLKWPHAISSTPLRFCLFQVCHLTQWSPALQSCLLTEEILSNKGTFACLRSRIRERGAQKPLARESLHAGCDLPSPNTVQPHLPVICSHNLEEPQPPLSHRHTSRYCLSFNYLTLLIFFKYFLYFVFVEAFSIHTRIKMCFRCCWFNADVICSPGKELRGVERIHLLCLALPA